MAFNKRAPDLHVIYWRQNGIRWYEFAFGGDYSNQMWLGYNHKTQCYVAVPDGANVAFTGQKPKLIGRFPLAAIERFKRENPEYTWQIITTS